MKTKGLLFLLTTFCFICGYKAQKTLDEIVNDAYSSVSARSRRVPSVQAAARFLVQELGGGAQGVPARQTTAHPIPADYSNLSRTPPGRMRGGTTAVRYHAMFSKSNAWPYNKMIHEKGMFITKVGQQIAQSAEFGGGTPMAYRAARDSPEVKAKYTELFRADCFEKPVCDFSNPYREADGSCNNRDNPLLGRAFTPQRRVLPAAYDDYQNAPRTKAVSGHPLPSARTVSNLVLNGTSPVSSVHSPFFTHFGQLIDHDVIATPSSTESDGSPIVDCCEPSGRQKEDCFVIKIQQPDSHFRPPLSCMHFVRHLASPSLDCSEAVRQQQNGRSSFVDGTMVYGFDKMKEMELRSCRNGHLKESQVIDGLLPPLKDCPIQTRFQCFDAGDHRSMEIPPLTVMHTTFLRRHNLIADALRRATGITNNEVLYQEAKRIAIAEIQHITYNEFLPLLLNRMHMTEFNLRSRRHGHAQTYNPKADPSTINAFGVAAYRFGHSLVRNEVAQDDGRGRVMSFPLHEHFQNPDLMFQPRYGYEFMARWMSRDGISQSDASLVDDLRNRLFEGEREPGSHHTETVALDLGGLNIQRGRDHGIPSYNEYRRWCGLRPAYHFGTSYGGLVDHANTDAMNLRQAYRHPQDIDLFAGGISELPSRGSIIGPTFQCLIAYQFSLYKHGDRFWYENRDHLNPRAAFTAAQLNQIKQVTLAKIMCSVVKRDGGLTMFQPQILLRPDRYRNRRMACRSILQGQRLGFDITPFAQELTRLGGCRRCSSTTNPIRCENEHLNTHINVNV